MTNVGYIVAAYSLAAVIIIGYTLSLGRRLVRARAEAEALERGAGE